MTHLILADHGGAAHLLSHLVGRHLVEEVLLEALVALSQVAHLHSLLLLSLGSLLETRRGDRPCRIPRLALACLLCGSHEA